MAELHFQQTALGSSTEFALAYLGQEEKIGISQLTLEARRPFLKLPLEERRKGLAEQAYQLAEHYEQESPLEERTEWQGGDID